MRETCKKTAAVQGPSSSCSSTTLELQKKNLNVAAGGQIYERAKSRRERHRAALSEAAVESVALTSRSGVHDKKKRKKVFETEDEMQERYETMGRHRVLAISSAGSLPKQIISATAVRAKAAKLKAQRLQQQQGRGEGKKSGETHVATKNPKKASSSLRTVKSRIMDKIVKKRKH